MKLIGKKIHIVTDFRDYWIVPQAETKMVVFSDGVVFDERNTDEPMMYMIRFVGNDVKTFLAKLEAYETVNVICPRIKIAKKHKNVNYEIEVDENNIAREIKYVSTDNKTYLKFEFINCKVIN